jgi:hypothetical protein
MTDNPPMQSDFFPRQLTVMRFASWLGKGVRDERELPRPPGDYKITAHVGSERWTVTLLETGEDVYNGIGPVEVIAADLLLPTGH